MPRSPLPPEARRLRRLLYDDPDSDCVRGLPLKGRITESLFADLLVGCLHRNQERAERFLAHDRAIHSRLLNEQGVQAIRKAADSWPFAATHAERALAIDRERRRHHDEVAAWAKAEGRFFHPIICLYALFRYLVEPRRGDDPEDPDAPLEGIEFYVKTYFPRILNKAGLHPHQKKVWTADNILRTFRRRGGKPAADIYSPRTIVSSPTALDRRLIIRSLAHPIQIWWPP